MTNRPTIETERLILRPPVAADYADYRAMVSDEDTVRYAGGVADAETSWRKFLQLAGMWEVNGFGPFIARERDGGGFVGVTGIGTFARQLGEDFDPYPEGAWVLCARAHGRGLAREAMTAAIDWFDTAFGRQRLVCIIAPENAASLKLADKLGFAPFGEDQYHGENTVKLARAVE
jgi:RimJ/RimL family protein N-acetyltransferase